MFKYFSPALFSNFITERQARGKTANSAETLTAKRARDHKIAISVKVLFIKP